MPSCSECKHLDKSVPICKIKCDKGGRTPTRNCIYAIFAEEMPLLKGKILEIGGGQWNPPRKYIRSNKDCKYYGIDPKWGDCPELGGYKGSVGKLPFEDNFFDRVLAFETMEHWAEHKRTTIPKGLSEINRVLKPDCEVCITVPIYLHGTSEFTSGNMKVIHGYFENPSWKDIRFQEWRKDYEPLSPSQNWRGTLEYYQKISTQKVPSSWCLRINAKKT